MIPTRNDRMEFFGGGVVVGALSNIISEIPGELNTCSAPRIHIFIIRHRSDSRNIRFLLSRLISLFLLLPSCAHTYCYH